MIMQLLFALAKPIQNSNAMPASVAMHASSVCASAFCSAPASLVCDSTLLCGCVGVGVRDRPAGRQADRHYRLIYR